MGRRKSKKTKDKNEVPHLPLELHMKLDYFSKYHTGHRSLNFSCTSKMWKSAPGNCSQSQHQPWLALHLHQNSQPGQVTGTERGRYSWLTHTFPCRGHDGCCPQSVWLCEDRDDLTWTKKECNIDDPNAVHAPGSIQFTNSTWFKEAFYVLSLQGTLGRLERVEGYDRKLNILKVKRLIPSVPSIGFREYVLEFSSEMLVVFLIYKYLMDIVDGIEVYQFDLPTLAWIRMRSLRNHALLLSNNKCIDISPSHLGHRKHLKYLSCSEVDDWWNEQRIKKNCIYFSHGKTEDLFVFDMDNGSIVAAK